MIIGKFQQDEGVFIGTIVGLGGTAPVRIAKTDLKGIDYTVTVTEAGLDLGIAWQKKSAKGNDYLSIKLDNPFLAAPVNCALLKQSSGYALIWEREKPKAESADAE
jgi:uncharacterized protein (DUF736 family)